MLDIQIQWFLVLVANFLVLIFLLNKILYQPVLKMFDERKNTVKGSLDAARDMDQKKEEGIAEMNRELGEARNKARDIFEGLKEQGMNRQKEILSEADGTAGEMLQKARDEIRAEADRARQKLKADVEKFSDEIVRKLVGV